MLWISHGRSLGVGFSIVSDMQRLRYRLHVASNYAGLPQQELADAAQAARQTIGLIEAGRHNPSLKLCTAICKTLGKTLDDLFWE